MSKKRFARNEPTACVGDTSSATKKELIAREKAEVNGNKARLKRAKKYMNTLKKMSSDYDYNQNHLSEMVGSVYMKIDSLKGYIENSENRIKMFRKRKKQ